jgi:hypothetical protein
MTVQSLMLSCHRQSRVGGRIEKTLACLDKVFRDEGVFFGEMVWRRRDCIRGENASRNYN